MRVREAARVDQKTWSWNAHQSTFQVQLLWHCLISADMWLFTIEPMFEAQFTTFLAMSALSAVGCFGKNAKTKTKATSSAMFELSSRAFYADITCQPLSSPAFAPLSRCCTKRSGNEISFQFLFQRPHLPPPNPPPPPCFPPKAKITHYRTLIFSLSLPFVKFSRSQYWKESNSNHVFMLEKTDQYQSKVRFKSRLTETQDKKWSTDRGFNISCMKVLWLLMFRGVWDYSTSKMDVRKYKEKTLLKS